MSHPPEQLTFPGIVKQIWMFTSPLFSWVSLFDLEGYSFNTSLMGVANGLRVDGGCVRPAAERELGVLRANLEQMLGQTNPKDRKTADRVATFLRQCRARDDLFLLGLPCLARLCRRSGDSQINCLLRSICTEHSDLRMVFEKFANARPLGSLRRFLWMSELLWRRCMY